MSFDPNLMHIHKEMLTEDAKLIYLLNCYYFAAAAYSIIYESDLLHDKE